MTFEMLIVSLIVALFIGLSVFFVSKVVKRRRRSAIFRKKWKEIQSLCADRQNWGAAIIKADELLGKALKRKNFKGKNTGERMVAAQKVFSDNNAVWTAHKLSMRLKEHPKIKLRKTDVKASLLTFGRALKDLGVL